MNDNLPNVFANPLNKEIKNSQEIYYSLDRGEKNVDLTSVVTKINRIFASTNHVYKSKVRITLKDGTVEKEVVGKTNGSLLTIDGEAIKIIDILDIERV